MSYRVLAMMTAVIGLASCASDDVAPMYKYEAYIQAPHSQGSFLPIKHVLAFLKGSHVNG